MAYIGAEPQIGNYQICDAISVVNGQAAYTMQVNSTNVVPESVNHMLVSLNGVLQKPGSSYTISSSTITFSSNLATGDSIDFIILLGNVLDLGVPSDDTVTGAKIVDDAINSEHYTDGSIDTAHIADANITTAKIAGDAITEAKIADDAVESEHLNNNIISGQTELAAEPADTDEFLVSDAGTIKRVDYSYIKGGGITEADQWRLSADTNQNSNADVTSNWERNDSSGWSKIGTGLSESSGIFSFASTGIYLITFIATFTIDDGDGNVEFILKITTDNSSYSEVAQCRSGNAGSANISSTGISNFLFDVQDTSNYKFKFTTGSFASASKLQGATGSQQTGFVVIRLGDT